MAPSAPATAEFLSRQFQGLDADTVVRLFAGDFAGLEEEVSPELLLFARVIHELARDLLETARSELENLTPEQVAEGMGRIYGFLLYTAAGLLLSAGAATALKGQRIVALAKQLRRLPGLKSPAAQKAVDKLMDALRLLEPPKRGRADPPTPTAPPLAARPVEEATEIADDLFVDVAPNNSGLKQALSVVTREGSLPRTVDWFDEAAVLEELSSSPIGQTVLDAAESNQFRLEFSKSFYRQSRELSAPENPIRLGVAMTKKAKVFLPAHSTNAGVARTAVHEGVHMLGVRGSIRAEVLARSAEVIHAEGKIAPFRLKQIYREVLEIPVYKSLPRSGGQQSSLFPGVEF